MTTDMVPHPAANPPSDAVTRRTELIDRFERCAIDNTAFHHRDHIRMVWSYHGEFAFAEAAFRFTEALKRFAAANGKPELYHETITWAFLVIVRERMVRGGEDSWDEFAEANADLFAWNPSLLDSLYRPGTLGSDLARRAFLLPDASLAWPRPLIAG